ncbi:MAG: LpxI family protein [Alphaproteobacteria bacterium]
MDKTAILAGQGALPALLASPLGPEGCVVISFEGQPPPALPHPDIPHVVLPMGKIQRILDTLRWFHVRQVVFAGAMQRPNLSDVAVDFRGAKVLAKLALRRARGDNALLCLLMEELEKDNITVVGAHTVRPDLTPQTPFLGKHKPSSAHQQDIDLGFDVLAALSDFDMGQAVIVREGQVLGIEGTDALIQRLAPYTQKKRKHKAVLIKAPKRNQDLRLDMPTIGAETLKTMAKANLGGVALRLGATLILDQPEVIALANTQEMFVTCL